MRIVGKHPSLDWQLRDETCFVTLYGVPLIVFKYHVELESDFWKAKRLEADDPKSCEHVWTTNSFYWEMGGLGNSLEGTLVRINSTIYGTKKTEMGFKRRYFKQTWTTRPEDMRLVIK